MPAPKLPKINGDTAASWSLAIIGTVMSILAFWKLGEIIWWLIHRVRMH
jgi:hypothetical protein